MTISLSLRADKVIYLINYIYIEYAGINWNGSKYKVHFSAMSGKRVDWVTERWWGWWNLKLDEDLCCRFCELISYRDFVWVQPLKSR